MEGVCSPNGGKTFATGTKPREAKDDTWLEENGAVPL